MANYKIAPIAEEDLIRIWLYGCENWGEVAANEYIATFSTHFEHLATYPEAHPVFKDAPEYRRSVHRGKNVFYRILDGYIEISAITRHQNTEKHLRRAK